MRFADYFGRAFASVNASQFPWMKTLKESSVAKMVDVSFSFSLSLSFVSFFSEKEVKESPDLHNSLTKSCTVETRLENIISAKRCFCILWIIYVSRKFRFGMQELWDEIIPANLYGSKGYDF